MKKHTAVSILLLGVLLSGCSNIRLPDDSLTEQGDTQVNSADVAKKQQTTENGNDTGAPKGRTVSWGIDPDSRDAVIRSMGYDEQKFEKSKVFLLYISDELENKEEILEAITSSRFCKEWQQVYSLMGEVEMQKEQLNPEWAAWNDRQDMTVKVNDSINVWGYIDPFRSIYSTPDQEETVITAMQVAEEREGGGYTGALAVNCEAGDTLKILYIPNDLGMDKWDRVQPQQITVGRVTMDTPWWINTVGNSSDPILVLSWEDYKEIIGDDLDTATSFYAVWDQGDNQELRKLVEGLCAEYGADNKMILWKDPYFDPK